MPENKITDHYLVEDIDQVFEEIERFSAAAMKGFKLAEHAQFEMKNALINEMEVAYAKLEMLNRKKIDSEITAAANEEIRRLVL